MSYERIEAKFRDCAQHAAVPIPETQVEKAIRVLQRLEEVDDVRRLTDLFLAQD